MACRRAVVPSPLGSGRPRTESIPLPRHPPRRSRRDHLRLSGWLTRRAGRLRLRHEAHRGAGSGAALVSRSAPVGPDRFPAGAVAAQVPPRLQAAVSRRQQGVVARRPPHRVDGPSLDHDRAGVDFLGEGLRRAFALLLVGDAEVSGVVLLTLKVAVTATLIACILGLPLGFFLATRPFWGRRAAFTLVNTALAFPTVVTGLLLFGLL